MTNIKIDHVLAGSMTREVTGLFNGRTFSAYRGKGFPSGNFRWHFRSEHWSEWTDAERNALTRAMNRKAIKQTLIAKEVWN